MKKTLILSCALALAGLSNVALAANGAGGFIGADLGSSTVDTEFTGSDSDATYGVRGGYFFNKHIAVEAFATSLYDADIEGLDTTLSGVGAGLVLKNNYGKDGNGFFLDWRLGVSYLRGEVGSEDDTSTKPYVGMGAGYDFSDKFGMSVNYTAYKASFEGLDVDANTLTAAAEFRF